MTSSLLSDTELEKQRLEGSINVYNEQIKTVEANNTHYSGRINAINAELKQKNDNINSLNEQKVQLSEQLSQYQKEQETAESIHNNIVQRIAQLTSDIESRQNTIYDILNEKSVIKADNQKYQTNA